jgi:hypothetical protein
VLGGQNEHAAHGTVEFGAHRWFGPRLEQRWPAGPRPLALLVRIVAAVGAIFLLASVSGALAWSALLSYEDVHSVVHSRAFPQFGATALETVVGARTIVGVWLAGTIAQVAGAFTNTRAMCRDFDVAVGRPTRPRVDARRS